MQINGTIRLPGEIKNKDGKIYIRVQDSSLMDEPAITIAEIELNYPEGKNELPFKLKVEQQVDPRSSYTLFVHLDLDHDKQLSTGDWMHSQAYSAIVNGQPVRNLDIFLRQIVG